MNVQQDFINVMKMLIVATYLETTLVNAKMVFLEMECVVQVMHYYCIP